MRALLFLISALFATAAFASDNPTTAQIKPVAAKAGSAVSSVPAELRAVERRYQKAATLTAKFTQVAESNLTHTKTTTQGALSIKRPDKIRWETQSPEPNLLISDGKKFWYYTPPFESGEKGQVILRKSTQVQSRFANALLQGSFSRLRGLKIETDPELKSAYRVTPKKGSAGTVLHARVVLSQSGTPFIEKVILEHKGGNHTEITLTDVRLGTKLDDSTFIFDPPTGTDIVTE